MADIRVWLIQGQTLQQDYDVSSLINALVWGLGGVISWFNVSLVWPWSYSVAIGTALIKCVRTGQINPIFSHFQNRVLETLTGVSDGDKIWLEVKQTHIDDWSLQNITGTNIWEIKFWATLPSNNFLHLATIDTGWAVIINTSSIYISVIDQITNVINQILNGDVWYFTENVTWAINTPSATFTNPVTAITNPAGATKKALLVFKSNQTNTWPMTLTINTSLGSLTAPLRKNKDVDLNWWDIKSWQWVMVEWDWVQFQMMSQLAQVPIWTTQNSSYIWVAWEDVTAWMPWFVGKWEEFVEILSQSYESNDVSFGDWANIRIQEWFICQKYPIISSIAVKLRKVGNPWDAVEMRIYEEDQITLLATSIGTISAWILTGSYDLFNFYFDNLTLIEGNRYHMELRRTWSQSWANYYQAIYWNSYDVRTFWQFTYFDWSWFSILPWHLRFDIQTSKNYENWKRYISDSDFKATGKVDWIFEENKLEGESVRITIAWINNNQLLLNPWSEYFINNNVVWEAQKRYNTTFGFWYQAVQNEKAAQSFIINRAINTDRLFLRLYNIWSPIDNAIIRIETDNDWVPSWILVDPNAVATISWSSLTTWLSPLKYNFSGFFNIPADTVLHIVFERSGALSTIDYYWLWIRSADIYPQWKLMKYESSIWSDAWTQDLFFDFLEQFDWLELPYYATVDAIWYDIADNEKKAQSFLLDKDQVIEKISLMLDTIWTPIDTLQVRIETDSWNNPSWILVDPNAVATFSGLNPVLSRVFIDFSGAFTLNKLTQYWIVIQRSGALSTINYYRIWVDNSWNSEINWFVYNVWRVYESWIWLDDISPITFNFWKKYYKRNWIITVFPVWESLLTEKSYYAKVWKAMSNSWISLGSIIEKEWISQSLSNNTVYFSPFWWHLLGVLTYSWWFATWYMSLEIWDTPDTMVLVDANNTWQSIWWSVWVSAYIPKWKWFRFNLSTNVSGTYFKADFYLK